MQVYIKIKDNIVVISDANLLKCEFVHKEEVLRSYEFGLCGVPDTLVMGPYYDTYMDWVKKEDMPKERLLRSGDEVVVIPEASEEWGNHRVDIDKSYLDEDFNSSEETRALFNEGKRCSIIEDIYVLKDAFGFNGTACAYYYQEIICPDDREGAIFIGSSDPYKVWINGEEIAAQRDNRFWYPNNDVHKIKFRKGTNPVVVKIARKGADNTFSMFYRYEQVLVGYDSAPYMTDLAFTLFSQAIKCKV